MTTTTTIDPTQLPATIRGFLAAHAAREVDTAAAHLHARTPSSSTKGETFRGDRGRSATSCTTPAVEYTYTTELVGGRARRRPSSGWRSTGSRATSRAASSSSSYRFTLVDDLIAELVHRTLTRRAAATSEQGVRVAKPPPPSEARHDMTNRRGLRV